MNKILLIIICLFSCNQNTLLNDEPLKIEHKPKSEQMCSDKINYCFEGMVCSPDNKRCVKSFTICEDQIHWCDQDSYCSNDSLQCLK